MGLLCAQLFAGWYQAHSGDLASPGPRGVSMGQRPGPKQTLRAAGITGSSRPCQGGTAVWLREASRRKRTRGDTPVRTSVLFPAGFQHLAVLGTGWHPVSWPSERVLAERLQPHVPPQACLWLLGSSPECSSEGEAASPGQRKAVPSCSASQGNRSGSRSPVGGGWGLGSQPVSTGPQRPEGGQSQAWPGCPGWPRFSAGPGFQEAMCVVRRAWAGQGTLHLRPAPSLTLGGSASPCASLPSPEPCPSVLQPFTPGPSWWPWLLSVPSSALGL